MSGDSKSENKGEAKGDTKAEDKQQWMSDFDIIPSWATLQQAPAKWSKETEKQMYDLLDRKVSKVCYTRARENGGVVQNCVVTMTSGVIMIDSGPDEAEAEAEADKDKYRFMMVKHVRDKNKPAPFVSDFDLVSHNDRQPAMWDAKIEQEAYALMGTVDRNFKGSFYINRRPSTVVLTSKQLSHLATYTKSLLLSEMTVQITDVLDNTSSHAVVKARNNNEPPQSLSDFDLVQPDFTFHKIQAGWGADVDKKIYELMDNVGSIQFQFSTKVQTFTVELFSDGKSLCCETTNSGKLTWFSHVIQTRSANKPAPKWRSDFNLVKPWHKGFHLHENGHEMAMPKPWRGQKEAFVAQWNAETERLVYMLFLKKRTDLVSYRFRPSWNKEIWQTCNIELHDGKVRVDTNDTSNGGMYRYMPLVQIRTNNVPKEEDMKVAQPSDNECVICLAGVKNHIILPCAHLCLCADCVDGVKATFQCPMCKGGITEIKKVFG